ncbi:SdpI family protein [Halorientalis salina]|uniref:SdpI family protein n=1 Tax=Halorientalis salina TaxID=2932266 RepID=UPI0010AD4179|nr:SdpI family protein [Halorientalis salina]
MRSKSAAALAGTLVAGMAVASVLVDPRLPETMVVHWDAAGNPNDTTPKVWGQFFLPLLTAVLVGFLFAVPRIDPNRANIEAFRDVYDEFVVVLTAFLAMVHAVVLAVNVGYDVAVDAVVFSGVGFLVFFIGTLLERTEQNWFVGIRTPWTLSDEDVWDRTHEVGAPLFKLSGVIAFVGGFSGQYAVYLAVGPVVVSSLALTVYSYYLYEREGQAGEATP